MGRSKFRSRQQHMKGVLVITPCSRSALPTQGLFIAERLRQAGIRIGVLSKARSSFGRLLDVIASSPFLIPRYDSVFVNVYGERAFTYESFAIIIARLWKRRTVVLVHNGRMDQFVLHWPRWTKAVLSCADLVVVPHAFLHRQLSTLGVRVDMNIPNFIELKRYRFRERSILAPRFLYLRGMYPYYNPQMAIRTFSLVQDKYQDARLTMAGGEGKENAICQRLVPDCN